MTLRSLLGALLIGAFFIPADAFGQRVPSHLDDIVGERARQGERDLRDRGYVHIQTQKGGDRSFGMWWNQARHECVTVTTQNGRFMNISESMAFDCNQHHSDRDDDDSSTGEAVAGAAIAIGAAALIGALASSGHHHKSHHHEDGRHHDDDESEREFERGHRDGLHHHPYDNYNDTQAYRRGFNSGVEQRRHNTSHREHSRRQERTYRPVRHDADDFARLSGEQASSTDGTLRSWGFNDVDSFDSGNTRYTIWYNTSTRQCLQMTTADGETVAVSDIGFHASCH